MEREAHLVSRMGGQVSRVLPAVLELLQHALPLALLLVAVDGVAADLPLEGSAELVAPARGVARGGSLRPCDLATRGCAVLCCAVLCCAGLPREPHGCSMHAGEGAQCVLPRP